MCSFSPIDHQQFLTPSSTNIIISSGSNINCVSSINSRSRIFGEIFTHIHQESVSDQILWHDIYIMPFLLLHVHQISQAINDRSMFYFNFPILFHGYYGYLSECTNQDEILSFSIFYFNGRIIKIHNRCQTHCYQILPLSNHYVDGK